MCLASNTQLTTKKYLHTLIKPIIILFCVLRYTVSDSISLTLSSTTINTNSIYNFEIFDTDLVNRDGTITIQFSATYFTIGTVSVYNTLQQSQTYAHSVLNNNKVSITYTRPAQASPVLQLSIATVKNPGSTVSVTFIYKFTSGGVQFSSLSKIQTPYTAATLQACSITFNPSETHTQSIATVSMTLRNFIASGSTIYIQFPSYWQNSYQISAYKPIMYSTTTCTKVSGASLASSPICTKFSDQIVYIDGGITSDANSGQVISFTMSGILTPATLSPNNFVKLSTQTSSGAVVDESSCQVTVSNPQTLTLTTSSSFTVGKSSQTITFNWATSSPLIVNDTIAMVIPQNYMQYGSVNPFISYNNGVRIRYTSTAVSSLKYQFKITAINQSTTQFYVSPTDTVQVSFIYLKCLIDTSPRSILVTVSRNSYKISEGTLSITPNANALTQASLSSTIKTVSAASVFTVGFKLTNSIPTTSGKIQIQVPSTIQLTGSQPTCSVSSATNPQSLSGNSICSISSRKITLSSFLSNPLPILATLSIQISNALKNPLTTEPTGTFIIKTISSNDYAIDQNTALTYTATKDVISSLTITPTSYVVNADTTYTFVYTTNKQLPFGSSISITLPTQITTLTSTAYTYKIGSGSAASIVPTTSTDSNGKKVLTFNNIAASNLVSGSIITITADKFHNPESLEPTSSFTVNVFSSTNYDIQSLSSGKSITMQTLASFPELTPLLSASQKINGDPVDYTFYFKTSITLVSSSKMILQIVNSPTNNQLAFSSSVTICDIVTPTTTLSNTCLLSNNQLTVTLVGSIAASTSTQYRLIVSSIVLARTMDATSQFKLTAYNANNYGIMQTTVNALTNTIANTVKTLSLSISNNPSQLNQIQSFSVSFTLFNKIYFASGQYCILQIPAIYTFIGSTSDPNICSNTNVNCTILDSNNPNAIKIASSTISTSTISLTVTIKTNNYVSPKDFGYSNDYFYLTSYSLSNKKIDQTSTDVTPVAFKPTCNDYCKTCRTSNLSYCLTCYSLNSGYDTTATYSEYIYMTSDSQCVNQCGNGYYNNSGTCTPCSSPCATCSSSATQCLSCDNGYFFDNSVSQCVIQCPQKTYEDSSTNTCEDCSTSCYNCTTNPITCTSCTSGKYLLNGICGTECGYGYFEDTVSGLCKACDAGCDGCGTSSSDCLACKSGYFLQSANSTKCVSDCPTGTVKNTVTDVCQCGGSCVTCSGTLTSCTSCESGVILYENACINTCPAQTYTYGTNCVACNDKNCLNCTSSECKQCSSGYLLYNGLCATECPIGTYKTPNQYTCSLCTTGCSTCLTQTICDSCLSGFLIEGSQCVTTCSTGYINFNASKCVTQCPSGYTNSSNRCVQDSNSTDNNSTNNNTNNTNNTNDTNSTNTTTNTTQTIPTIVPVPLTLSFLVTTSLAVAMKCFFAPTLLSVSIMSFGSVLELSSVVVLVSVGYIQQSSSSSTNTTQTTARLLQTTSQQTTTTSISIPLLLLIAALGLMIILNILNLIFILKYLHNDSKFLYHYNKSKCGHTVIRIISMLTCFKFHQIVFSNILNFKVFKAKLEFVNRMYVFNVLLICSIFWSVLVLVGAGLINYNKQDQKLNSTTFLVSIDCLIVVVLNIIPTILVLRRKQRDYCQEIQDDDQQKRYETNEELHFNQDQSGEGIDQVFIQENGVGYANQSHLTQSRKDYFYKNSNTPSGQKDNDAGDGPLSKRTAKGLNPIKQRKNSEESSSAALMKTNKNQQSKVKKIGELDENDEIEQITLEQPVRDNMLNSSPKRNKIANQNQNNMNNYTGYDLDPKLLTLSQSSAQFKKLPAQTKSKIRLAKANMQINKNSQQLHKNQTINADLEEIQLSPKKKKKIGPNGQEIIVTDSDQEEKKSRSKSKSKQKNKLSKSKSKDKSLKKSKEGGSSLQKRKKLKNGEIALISGDTDQQANGTSLTRNRSEQMKKKNQLKDALQINTTKSQNIKKRKKKVKEDKNNIKIRNNKDDGLIEDDEQYDEEPSLPVFKARKKKNNGSDDNNMSDGLNDGQGKNVGIRKSGLLSDRDRISQGKDKKKVRNRSNSNGNKNQGQTEDVNKIHSEHISSLIIKNKSLRYNNSIAHENDDQSIYKKIYNDDTETLKSLQNDLASNYFNQQISPSQFNYQNQRFDETDISQNQNIPEKPIVHIQGLEIDEDDDGLDGPYKGKNYQRYDQQPEQPTLINRYASQQNIMDYDSVLSRRVNNEKIKELQKIYLPRLQVKKPLRRK